MSHNLCDICKKEIAKIQITGEGAYCLKCHNEIMLGKYDLENSFDYAEFFSVVEPNGEIHTFKIQHIILGSIVSWEAIEQGGNYIFKEISDIRENGKSVAQRFFRKVVDGVCTKSLEENSYLASNLAYQDGKCFYLRSKGTVNIVENKNSEGEIAFQIDGRIFSATDFARLLGAYQGHFIQYEIKDISEPILKENEYLVPIHITKQSLIDELEVAINIYSDRGFVSYKQILAFDRVFRKIIDKLEVFLKSEKKAEAIDTGRELLRMLLSLETDDDYFPVYHIEYMSRLIDPFGVDVELKKIIQDWENSIL